MHWRIQSWSEGGFPNVANVSGRSGSVPVTVSPPDLKNHGGGVSVQPENPPGYATAMRDQGPYKRVETWAFVSKF